MSIKVKLFHRDDTFYKEIEVEDMYIVPDIIEEPPYFFVNATWPYKDSIGDGKKYVMASIYRSLTNIPPKLREK